MYRTLVPRIILCCLLINAIGCTLASSSESLPESDHPYLNYFEKTWIIEEPGAQQIRLHFENLDLAKDEGIFPHGYDKLIILDKYYNELTTYGSRSGFTKTDFWTDWYTGDTLIVKLVTDDSGAGYGFKIDDKGIRTGVGTYNNSLYESDHPYANNLEYTFPIYTNGSTKIRIHFEKLELAKDEGIFPHSYDKLIILDKYGNELAKYGEHFGFERHDFWTEWFTGDTFIVKLVTDDSGTGDGFKIDKLDPRQEEDNHLIRGNTSSGTIGSIEVSELRIGNKASSEATSSQTNNYPFSNINVDKIFEISLFETNLTSKKTILGVLLLTFGGFMLNIWRNK